MTTEDVKRPFDFSASDFASIVTTRAYVDKSLMIRDVYNASSKILITAPRRFGKSTNLDMVKRFFEIEVAASGNPKTVNTTSNYKLFNTYNLEICKDTGFWNEHFGKHPVVHIDFKPLGRVDDSAKILDVFKSIVENSLNQHNYILKSYRTECVFIGITDFNLNDFLKYVFDGKISDVDGLNLANSFNHLATILNRIFGKKVFVLIDSYDSFLDSPLFKNNADRDKMMSFVESSIGQLLNNVGCVDRVLITGVIPVIGEGFLSSENNIEFYPFLDSHPFTKYYGMTSGELDTVLNKFIESDEEKRDVRSTLNDYYNAYETSNRAIRLYNVYSVLKYVCRRTVQSYWCERRYINKFKKCFKIEPIRLKLQELLAGNELQLDVSQPLSMADVLKVNRMITSGNHDDDDGDYYKYTNIKSKSEQTNTKRENLSIEVELLFVIFYYSGYLSVINEIGSGADFVNIASKEIKYELGKAVFDENRQLYSSPQLDGILSALDAFQPDTTDPGKYVQKCQNYNLAYITNFIESLFMNFIARTKHSRVMCCTIGPNGPKAVLLKNKHQVAVCVTRDRSQNASVTHLKVTNEEHIFDAFNDVRGKLIIAIGLVKSHYGIAYSYYFRTGDNLREVRTLR